MKPEYRKGAEARKNFEETMSKLFRAPKPPKPPKKAASEEKRNRCAYGVRPVARQLGEGEATA